MQVENTLIKIIYINHFPTILYPLMTEILPNVLSKDYVVTVNFPNLKLLPALP